MSFDESSGRWRILRKGRYEAEGLEIPTIDTGVSTGFGTVRWALGTNGEPRLLLPIRQAEVVKEIEISPSLTVATAVYHLAGNPVRYIDIACTVGSLEAVFAEVADEVLRRVRNGETAQASCRSTLDDFRALLIESRAEVDPEKVCGLVGELVVLKDLIERESEAWRLWRGPLKERHDFRGDLVAIEVKSSSRVSNNFVRISSIDQLQEPAGGELILCLCHLEKVASGELTVSSLSAEIAAKASDPLAFRNLLAAVECPDPNAPGWNAIQFRLEKQTYYDVRANFPRITEATLASGALPAGVDEVSYGLDLGAALEFEMDFETAASVQDRIISCLA